MSTLRHVLSSARLLTPGCVLTTRRLPYFLHHNNIPKTPPGDERKRCFIFLIASKTKSPSMHNFMYCVVPESWPVSGRVQDRRGDTADPVIAHRTGGGCCVIARTRCCTASQRGTRRSYRKRVYRRTQRLDTSIIGHDPVWIFFIPFLHKI